MDPPNISVFASKVEVRLAKDPSSSFMWPTLEGELTDTHLCTHAIGGFSDPYDGQRVGCTAYEKRALCAVFHKISHLI